MQRLAKLLPSLALVGALSLVPIATTAMAAAESDTQKELETFFSVFERVRANYVDKVDDHTLIKGAIDGMLSALDPHSSYAEASDFQQLKTTTEGNYGGLGLTVSTASNVGNDTPGPSSRRAFANSSGTLIANDPRTSPRKTSDSVPRLMPE